jgi:hypothetical protein
VVVQAAEASPPTGPRGREIAGMLTMRGSAMVLVLVVGAVLWARRRAHSALGRVRRAARAALRATRGDVTLQPLRTHIRAMVSRAVALDATRRACARKLSALDVAALSRKRDAYARASGGPSSEALVWIAAECDEAERVKADLTSNVTEIDRIESALRVMTLRMREDRGTNVRAKRDDPVDAAAAELAYREQAQADVERATDP